MITRAGRMAEAYAVRSLVAQPPPIARSSPCRRSPTTRARTSAAFAETNRLAHAQVNEKRRWSFAVVARNDQLAGRRIGIESAVWRYENAGLAEIRWIEPEQSGFYQPIILARKS